MLFSTLLLSTAVGYVAASPALITVLAPVPGDVNKASIAGVDAAGHTTYILDEPVVEGVPGSASTTATVLHATLVAGSDYASETMSLSYAGDGINFNFVAGGECTIAGDSAICGDGTEKLTTDAAFVRASLTQVLDVVNPTGAPAAGSNSGSGSGPAPSGSAPAGDKPKGAAGRNAVAFGAVVIGAVVAGAGMLL